MRAATFPIACAALLVLWADPASAQSRKLIGIGVGVTADRPVDLDDWETSFDYLIFRIPRPERLGIAWDIGSDTTDIPPSTVTGFGGSLRMRHVLFGPGYTWRRGRIELTPSLLVGPSFNRFRLSEGSPPAEDASAETTVAIRPDVTCWIDLSARFGLKLAAHYQFSKVDLSVDTGAGMVRGRWNAGGFRTQAGIVFGIY